MEKPGLGFAQIKGGGSAVGEKKRKDKAAAQAAAENKPASVTVPAVAFVELALLVPVPLYQRIRYHYESYRAATPQNSDTSLREFSVVMLNGMVGLLDQAETDARQTHIADKLAAPQPVDAPPAGE